MGYDISFHPVDVAFIHDRVIPHVCGERDLDDLYPAALRIAKVRFRANAWGLGVLKLRDRAESCGFDSGLHVWGRPFFITSDAPQEVSEVIDRYLDADEAETDVIAREMVGRLDPGLVDLVSPDLQGGLPDDGRLLKSIFWKLDLFRGAYAALRAGRDTIEHEGDELDAAEIFATDFPLAAFTVAAHFRPGWMSRGAGWPTRLLASAGVEDRGLFQDPAALFEPLAGRVPQVLENLSSTILENYMVGGFVPAARTEELGSLVTSATPQLRAWAKEEGWADADLAGDLRKIHEAVADARRRGLAFAEATEVYSGPMGVMN